MMIFIHLEDGESTNEKERSYGSIMMEKLTGSPDGRIDHVLQVINFALRELKSVLCIGVLQYNGPLLTQAHNLTFICEYLWVPPLELLVTKLWFEIKV
jgi:hypothetical protein